MRGMGPVVVCGRFVGLLVITLAGRHAVAHVVADDRRALVVRHRIPGHKQAVVGRAAHHRRAGRFGGHALQLVGDGDRHRGGVGEAIACNDPEGECRVRLVVQVAAGPEADLSAAVPGAVDAEHLGAGADHRRVVAGWRAAGGGVAVHADGNARRIEDRRAVGLRGQPVPGHRQKYSNQKQGRKNEPRALSVRHQHFQLHRNTYRALAFIRSARLSTPAPGA